MSAQTLLSGGDKWFSYSGEVFGDVSAPATIQLNLIPNTGLRDSYVQIQSYFGKQVGDGDGTGLGIEIKINDVTVINSQTFRGNRWNSIAENPFMLFVPRQSKLEVISINTSVNNTQIRGCNILGYYL
tara:strand:- start:393 stop:776 length:384 start_codon:yes stop_codon:yes gene_type:complete